MGYVRVRNKKTGQQKVISQSLASALKDKYEIVREVESQELEVAPNSPPAATVNESETVAANDELEALRSEYEELYGEKPHHRLKADTIQKLINEKTATP